MMKRIILLSALLTFTTVFIACKKTEKKVGDSTVLPDTTGDYFIFKENGVLYEMDNVFLSTSNPHGENPIQNIDGSIYGSFPRRIISINIPDSISPKIGEFVIGGSEGVSVSYRVEEEDPNSSFNKTTKYDYNQSGILYLESFTGMVAKGTLEFTGYTLDGTQSVVVTEGKFSKEY